MVGILRVLLIYHCQLALDLFHALVVYQPSEVQPQRLEIQVFRRVILVQAKDIRAWLYFSDGLAIINSTTRPKEAKDETEYASHSL
jgi:hypothetical protein